MIVANELRSALYSWTDRLIALAVISILLVAMRSSLSDRPLIFAATAVAALATVIGAGAARKIERRLDFHAEEGVLAADALTDGARRRYILSAHALVCSVVIICALIARPATTIVASIGYLFAAGICHVAARLAPGSGSARRSSALRAARRFLQRPIAGAVAAIPAILPLVLLRSIEPGPRTAFVGLVSAIVAILLTLLDYDVVRFMSASGYRAGRIIGIHARSLLAFLALTVPASLALADRLVAVAVAGVVLAALVLLAARILTYRTHAKRTADMLVGICTAAACLAGFAMPIVLPLVVMAILWHLHRRAAAATWLLA